MAQVNVAISEGLSALPAWEHEPTDDDRMLMMIMMWVYIPKLAGQRSPSDLATMACAMWLAVPVDLLGFLPRPQFPWDQDKLITAWKLHDPLHDPLQDPSKILCYDC